MGLLSPWFLAGLAALGLPLWLHLLRQFKRTPQPFSSLMFFERQIQSSSKHRRLRYFILLALRMALLALLALLFSNPFINRASSAVAPRKRAVIAIDQSFSMRYGNRLADAKAQATQFVNSLSAAQSAQVLTLDSHTTPITQAESDKTPLKDAIASVEPTDSASSYGEFSRAIRVMQQSTGLALDVHLFTDAQQTSMPAAFSDLQLGPHTTLAIHEVGQAKSPNWAVQSVNIPSHIFDATNVRLTAGIAAWLTSETSRKVSVLLNGRAIASKEVSVPACGRAEVEFTNLIIPFGQQRGEVRIEPHDELPNDDSFLFSIERSDPHKVLFLHNPGRASDSFFFKSALDASTATGLRVQPQAQNESSAVDLSQYSLIVLNNPSDLDSQTTRRLSDYVSHGGSILIAVGRSTSSTGKVPIAGNQISETSLTQSATANTSDLFGSGAFDNVQFLSTPRITPNPQNRILARFADGSPLLLEQPLGEGKLLIFASTLDNSTSDFPVHASFLPFVAVTSAYLSGLTGDQSSVVVGSAIPLRQSKNQTASTDVLGPEGRHEIALSDATRVMAFNPLREGFFDVHSATGKRTLVAVHADRRESNLTKVPPETLILWRNTGSGGVTSPATATATTQVPFSLWRYILSFVLIAAILESIFATRYLSEERQVS